MSDPKAPDLVRPGHYRNLTPRIGMSRISLFLSLLALFGHSRIHRPAAAPPDFAPKAPPATFPEFARELGADAGANRHRRGHHSNRQHPRLRHRMEHHRPGDRLRHRCQARLILTNRHVVTPGPVTAQAIFLNREEVQLYPDLSRSDPRLRHLSLRSGEAAISFSRRSCRCIPQGARHRPRNPRGGQ